MTLLELQQILGKRIEITCDKSLSKKERVLANSETDSIVKSANVFIKGVREARIGEQLIREGKLSPDGTAAKLIGFE